MPVEFQAITWDYCQLDFQEHTLLKFRSAQTQILSQENAFENRF